MFNELFIIPGDVRHAMPGRTNRNQILHSYAQTADERNLYNRQHGFDESTEEPVGNPYPDTEGLPDFISGPVHSHSRRFVRPVQVIFHDPATIVYWADGTKTVVKCAEGDTYSPIAGYALCHMKKTMGEKGYRHILKSVCAAENMAKEAKKKDDQ